MRYYFAFSGSQSQTNRRKKLELDWYFARIQLLSASAPIRTNYHKIGERPLSLASLTVIKSTKCSIDVSSELTYF